ncbi:MAG: carbon-nitrogen hydrolase family protein [Phycisphaerae bacterium]
MLRTFHRRCNVPVEGIDNRTGAATLHGVKIALGQTGAATDEQARRENVSRLVEQAAGEGAHLVLFPEMSVLEFFPRVPHRYEFFKLGEPIPGPTMEWFAALAKQHRIAIVYNHFERSPEHLFFDCSVVIDRDGRFVGRQRMMHIAEEPGYNERFYYTPGWDTYQVFELNGWRFGVAICYDRHFPEVFRSFVLQGAELVLVPTAVAAEEPFARVYELEMQAAAVTHGVYIAMANRAGREEPLDFLGRSMVIDPQGEIVGTLDGEPNALLTADVHKESVTEARIHFPFLRDRRPETYRLNAPNGSEASS